LSLGVLFEGIASPRVARAQEPSPHAEPPPPEDIKNQCADAYEATQRERAAGHLLVARKNGIFCAQDSCPEVLRSDCAKWSDELASSVPSLVIEVRGPHGDLLSNVYVEVDGAPFVDHLDGRALEIDPGRHHFRFQALGLAPHEVDFVLLEGRETQHLRVTLALEPVKTQPPRSVPLASYLLGGVSVLGAGSFAYFGLTGNHLKSGLDGDMCRPACDKPQGDKIRRDWLVADLSLGAALVSLGVGTWLAVATVGQKAPPPEQALRIRAGTDGALLTFQRGF
jgi:hypothetical protein